MSAADDPGAAGGFELPLFPLSSVLYPGGVLPLRIFEQRYIAMTKACIANDAPFAVCLILQGSEVAQPGAAARGEKPDYARIGTTARIETWDMPQPGILHVRARGGTRVQVLGDRLQPDGLLIGRCAAVPAERARPVAENMQSVARLLSSLLEHIGASPPAADQITDASWVGYRVAELLPLPASIRQSMLEMNDSEVRLALLARYLRQQQVL